MRYWFRRRASNGEVWAIWVADTHPILGLNRAVTIPWERRIILNSKYRRDFGELLIHEWGHVELFANDVGGHIYNDTKLHKALTALAISAVRMPPTEGAP